MTIFQGEWFCSKLSKLKTKKEKLIHIQNEVDRLNKSTTSIGSLKKYFTKYRNMFRAKYASNQALTTLLLQHFKLTTEQQSNFKKTSISEIYASHHNLRKIIDQDQYIDIANTLIRSQSLYDLILGLSACTGRRVAEIACTAKFKATGNQRTVKFYGQLKTGKDHVDKGYEIPLLTDYSTVIRTIETLRKNRPQWLNETAKFNASTSKELGKKARIKFAGTVEEKVRVKDLRAIYAELAFLRCNTNQKITKNAYFAQILGHSEEDLNTCNSYMDFYIPS
jgi:hypothetical protein